MTLLVNALPVLAVLSMAAGKLKGFKPRIPFRPNPPASLPRIEPVLSKPVLNQPNQVMPGKSWVDTAKTVGAGAAAGVGTCAGWGGGMIAADEIRKLIVDAGSESSSVASNQALNVNANNYSPAISATKINAAITQPSSNQTPEWSTGAVAGAAAGGTTGVMSLVAFVV